MGRIKRLLRWMNPAWDEAKLVPRVRPLLWLGEPNEQMARLARDCPYEGTFVEEPEPPFPSA